MKIEKESIGGGGGGIAHRSTENKDGKKAKKKKGKRKYVTYYMRSQVRRFVHSYFCVPFFPHIGDSQIEKVDIKGRRSGTRRRNTENKGRTHGE